MEPPTLNNQQRDIFSDHLLTGGTKHVVLNVNNDMKSLSDKNSHCPKMTAEWDKW